MITAEEARKLTEERRNQIAKEYDIDFKKIFADIDMTIEEFIQEGKNEVYVTVDGNGQTLDCIYYKRENIVKHYSDLGYSVETLGYDRKFNDDGFMIKW